MFHLKMLFNEIIIQRRQIENKSDLAIWFWYSKNVRGILPCLNISHEANHAPLMEVQNLSPQGLPNLFVKSILSR